MMGQLAGSLLGGGQRMGLGPSPGMRPSAPMNKMQNTMQNMGMKPQPQQGMGMAQNAMQNKPRPGIGPSQLPMNPQAMSPMQDQMKSIFGQMKPPFGGGGGMPFQTQGPGMAYQPTPEDMQSNMIEMNRQMNMQPPQGLGPRMPMFNRMRPMQPMQEGY